MVYHLILGMEEWMTALEAKDVLTESHQQSVICRSKMLETIAANSRLSTTRLRLALKATEPCDKNKCSLLNSNTDHGVCWPFKGPFDSTQLSICAQALTNDRLVERQLDLLGDSVWTIKRMVANSDLMDAHILTNYIVEIRTLEGQFQGLKKEILSLDDVRGHVRKASDIEQTLFDLRVAIHCLMEQTKKEPAPQVAGMHIMGKVNLLQIKILTCVGNILNWWLFWEQYQATHDKSQLREVDRLTCLQGALKNGPAKNVIQGLTQVAKSYQEAVKCL